MIPRKEEGEVIQPCLEHRTARTGWQVLLKPQLERLQGQTLRHTGSEGAVA